MIHPRSSSPCGSGWDFTEGDTLIRNPFFSYFISHHPLMGFSPCHLVRSWETDLASIICSSIDPLLYLSKPWNIIRRFFSFVIDWVAPQHRPKYFKVCELRLEMRWLRQGEAGGVSMAPIGYSWGQAAEPLWLANKSWVWSCDGT